MPASTSPIVIYEKDPIAISDYTLNWRRWLGPDDRISSAVWTVPAGISNAGSFTSITTTTIWLSGGTSGTAYSIYVLITTVKGRTDKRTLRINVIDR